MRRADAIWKWDSVGLSLSDVTDSAGEGTATITLAPGDRLYIGHRDWISGAFLQIESARPAATPSVSIETYDGQSGDWKILPRQERVDQLPDGHSMSPQGFTLERSGVLTWNVSPWLWTMKTASMDFPEAATPPSEPELYWVRLTNTGVSALTFDRVLPTLYNTYASVEDLARFLGVQDFTDITDPLASQARVRIHAAEDWIDQHCRRTWRLRSAINERYSFNPYGLRTRHAPVWFVTRLAVWAGTQLVEMAQGRMRDFYVSDNLSMIYFTRIALGRGLPWAMVSSRYLRLPDSMELDYIYGEDFDVSEKRDAVHDIIVKRAAADIVRMQDWVQILVNNPDAVSKPEKVRGWMEETEMAADELRWMLLA